MQFAHLSTANLTKKQNEIKYLSWTEEQKDGGINWVNEVCQ